MTEAEQLRALLAGSTPSPNGRYEWPGWRELRDEGYTLDGFETVAVVEGSDRRWSRTDTVVTRAPSGAYLAWHYENGLTENQEDNYSDELPQLVERHEETVVVTSWEPVK